MRNKTRSVYVPYLLLALWFCFLCEHAETQTAAQAPIKIGVSVPLSGEAALYGTDTKNAIVFANEHILRKPYELVIEDDKCDGKEAATIAQKLVSVDQVRYVLGYPCSGALLAAAPILDRAGVVAISAMAMSASISGLSPRIFRTCPNNQQMAATLASEVGAKYQKVGMLTEETEYPQSLAREFTSRLQKDGVTPSAQNYLPNTTDFRTQLLKLKQDGVQALFINPQAEPAFVRILQQMDVLRWHPVLYGNLYPSSPSFLRLASGLADGIVFSDLPFFSDVISDQGEAWYKEYRTRFGEPVSSDLYFVTAVAAFLALDEAINSGTDVADYLHKHKFNSTMKQFSFTSQGDVEGVTPILKCVRSGKAVLYRGMCRLESRQPIEKSPVILN